MGMFEKLVGQFRFVDRCSPNHQSAVAKDLTVNLPGDDGGYDAVITLGLDHTSDYFGVRIGRRSLSPAFCDKVSMPAGVVRDPWSKGQALSLQGEANS